MAKAKQDIVQVNHLGQRTVVVPEGQDIPSDLKVKDGEVAQESPYDKDELDGMTREQLDAVAVDLGWSDAPDMGSKDEVSRAIRGGRNVE